MGGPVITAEESGHEPGHLRGVVEQEQVTSTPDNVQLCLRDALGEDPAVGYRHDEVIVAGQHQGLLPQGPQPGKAGPAADGVDLAEVAAQRRPGGELSGPGQLRRVRVATCGAAVGTGGDALVVAGPVVAARGGEREQGPW
jgi:hypothetical protein